MNLIYCDEAIKPLFNEIICNTGRIKCERNVYVLYEKRPVTIQKGSLIIANGDNPELLHSLAGTDCMVITCGMSGISTFTFSSISDERCVLCLQREVISFKNTKISPKEIPVSFSGSINPDKFILILAFAFLTQENYTAIKWEE